MDINSIGDIHAIQSVQTTTHEVSLVHGKATLVRVFITSADADALNGHKRGLLTGTLQVELANTGQQISLRPVNPLKFESDASESDPFESTIGDLDTTLNFILDLKEWEQLGVVDTFEQESVIFSTEDLHVVGQNKAGTVKFDKKQTPVVVNRPITMRLRAIGYRFTDPESGHLLEPAQSAINEVKQYVEAAFPVSELEWSWNIVEAPETFIKLNSVADENARAEEQIDFNYQVLFQHLLALRTTEINSDEVGAKDAVETNTIYIGLIADPTHRIGGASMDSPQFPTAQVVACCEATEDGELAAHEIAHMLGCEHPGYPDKTIHGRFLGQTEQDDDLKSQLGPIGEIMINEKQGYGVRFRTGSVLPQFLNPERFYELMSYHSPKWVSVKSYTDMMLRLDLIYNNINSKRKQAASGFFTIIGAYNLLNRDATVQFVLPSKHEVYPAINNVADLDKNPDPGLIGLVGERPPIASEGDGEGNSSDSENWTPVYVRSNPERTDANISIGIFQHSVKNVQENRLRYRLSIRGQPVEIVDLREIGQLLKTGIESDPIYQYFKTTEERVSKADENEIDLSFIDDIVNTINEQRSLITTLNSASTNEKVFDFNYDMEKGCLHLRYDWRQFFEIESTEFFDYFSIPLEIRDRKVDYDPSSDDFYSSISSLQLVLQSAIDKYGDDLKAQNQKKAVKITEELDDISKFVQQSSNAIEQDTPQQSSSLESRELEQQLNKLESPELQQQSSKLEPYELKEQLNELKSLELEQQLNQLDPVDIEAHPNKQEPREIEKQPIELEQLKQEAKKATERDISIEDDPKYKKEVASLKLFQRTLNLIADKDYLALTWITSFFALAKVPITTIVQVKHQSSADIGKGKWDINNYTRIRTSSGRYEYKPIEPIDRWETVYISKRLVNKNVWIPDRYLQNSVSHYSGDVDRIGLPNLINKKLNNGTSCEAAFKINYRVQLAIGGFTITMFDNSEAEKPGELVATVKDRLHGHRFDSGQDTSVLNRNKPSRYDALVDFHPIVSEK